MLRRIEKLKRYWQWRLKPSRNSPVFWHVGRPNFGDDINPLFLEHLSGVPLRLATDRDRPHLLGIGSILESATASSTVIGSGYLKPNSGPLPPKTTVISLRGERTFERSGCRDSVLLGDPLVLVNLLFEEPDTQQFELGLVPHVLNVKEMQAEYGDRAHVIDPALPPWQVVREIASCRRIASQSLHGLIVADALEVPNVWLAPSETMAGGRFKFDDYFSTLDREKEPVAPEPNVLQHPEKLPFGVCHYKYSKNEYYAALAVAVSAVDKSIVHGNKPSRQRNAA